MREDSFKYGMPLLCAEWLSSLTFLVGGGGGTAATGIKNRVVLAKFEDGVMSDQLTELSFADRTPVRSCMHSERGDVLIGFTNHGIAHLQIKTSPASIQEVQDSPVLDAFESIREEASCLVFSSDGRYFIGAFAGGWVQARTYPLSPSWNPILREEATYTTLKDLDVSPGSEPLFILLSTSKGTAELWDFKDGKLIQAIPKPGGQGERFVHGRFWPVADGRVFFTTVVSRKGSALIKWQIINNSAKRIRRISIGSEAASSFCVRRRVLVIGTSEGNISMYTANRMLPMQRVKGAHMVFITAMRFPPIAENEDPSSVLSVSGDASAKVTEIEYKSEIGLWLKSMIPYMVLNVLLVIIAIWLLLGSEFNQDIPATCQILDWMGSFNSSGH